MTKSSAADSIAPVRQSVRVPATPARSFKVFTESIREWWDPAMSASRTKEPIAEIVLEPRVGGRWFERGRNGTECEWARVLAWQPGARATFEWSPDGYRTTLELRFENPAPRATTLTLVHSGFEVYGDRATSMRDMHSQVWASLLQRYAHVIEEQRVPQEHADIEPPESNARAVTDGQTVLATVDVSAPADRIFRAITSDETEQWWGAPDTYRVTEWKSELCVGGRWSLVVKLPDGSPFPASGEYLAIDAPRRVTLTRRYEFDYPDLGRRDTTVTYQLDPITSGTRVTIRQDGFDGLRVAAEHHADGWVGFLTYLAAYLRAESASR